MLELNLYVIRCVELFDMLQHNITLIVIIWELYYYNTYLKDTITTATPNNIITIIVNVKY